MHLQTPSGMQRRTRSRPLAKMKPLADGAPLVSMTERKPRSRHRSFQTRMAGKFEPVSTCAHGLLTGTWVVLHKMALAKVLRIRSDAQVCRTNADMMHQEDRGRDVTAVNGLASLIARRPARQSIVPFILPRRIRRDSWIKGTPPGS